MSIQKIAIGAKPDPYKFTIVEREVVAGNTIIVARYEGCKTFDGLKMMLIRGEPTITETLDPHFLDEEYPVVARFQPNQQGWILARICSHWI